jgi:PPOX class probable F420-dependent enzyme
MLDLTQERDAHIDQRLREDIVVWFGTVRPDGRPHITPVWFIWNGADLLIFSKPNQRKIRNVRQNPRVVVALDNSKEGTDHIAFEGVAQLLADPTVNATLPAYVAKYGAYIEGIGYSPRTMAEAYSQAIRVTPTKFYDAPTA